ncbi:MAG TPA: NfeD family protein [Myxococcales bacterium]|nr:NfeD family protein [Myxococcales bacterium]
MGALALQLAIVIAALLVGGLGGFALGRAPIGSRRRLATNVHAIAGKRVKVLSGAAEGAEAVVLLTGEHWKARSVSGSLQAGDEARVVALDGLCLLVLPEGGLR